MSIAGNRCQQMSTDVNRWHTSWMILKSFLALTLIPEIKQLDFVHNMLKIKVLLSDNVAGNSGAGNLPRAGKCVTSSVLCCEANLCVRLDSPHNRAVQSGVLPALYSPSIAHNYLFITIVQVSH